MIKIAKQTKPDILARNGEIWLKEYLAELSDVSSDHKNKNANYNHPEIKKLFS